MLNTFLFDLDGTLTDSAPGIIASVKHALVSSGVEVTDDNELLSFVGPPLLEQFQKYANLTKDEAEDTLSIYREHYDATGMYMNNVYPGIPELLTMLKDKGARLAVVTSKEINQAVSVLKMYDLIKYFDAVIGVNVNNGAAPKKDLIERALTTLGLENRRDEVAMIGDRFYDIRAAKATGIRSVGVMYGYGNAEEFQKYGADIIADSVEDLGRVLTDDNSFPKVTVSNADSQNYSHQPRLNRGAMARYERRELSTFGKIWRVVLPLIIYFAIQYLVSSIATSVYLGVEMAKRGITFNGDFQTFYNQYYDIAQELIMGNYAVFSMVISAICNIISIPILVALFRNDKKRGQLPPYKIKSDRLPALKVGAVSLIMGFSISFVLNMILSITGISEWMYEMNPGRYDALSSLPVFWSFIVLCILAPVTEELLFRGLMFKRMREFMKFVPAALISATVFGIIHFDIVTGIAAFLIGVIMAFLYEKTGSIYVSMLFHFGFNFFSIVADLIPENAPTFIPVILFGVCIIASVLTIYWTLKNKDNLKRD